MADFLLAFRKTLGHEGGYANNPSDKGGETVWGIARNFFPKWVGWATIDEEKRRAGKQPVYGAKLYWVWVKKFNKTLAQFPLLKKYVHDFYQVNFWDNYRLGEVVNQEVADWLFDHVVNGGGRGVMWIQEALKVKVDGEIGPVTIKAINSADPVELLEEAEDVAAFYRLDRAFKNPSQIQFLPSWLRRDGVSEADIKEVMQAARDGLTYTEVAALKKMLA